MSLFDQRFRGFRVVEIGAVICLLILVLAVYLNKAGAGRERARIDAVQAQIEDEQTRVRLLKAEVAHLEQPERIEAMATQYLGLAATPAKHEIPPTGLLQAIEDSKKPVKKGATPAPAAPGPNGAAPPPVEAAAVVPAPAAPAAPVVVAEAPQ